MMPANLEAIRRALDAGSVEFIEPNGGGAGVRMKEPRASGPGDESP
jgi:hypothetical protein